AGEGDRQRRVLGGGVAVVGRHRGVVDRGNGQGDGGHVAVQGTVVGLVGEGVAAVVVSCRRVRERPVGVQRQGAVRRAADQGGGEGVAVHVGIVAQQAGGGDGQGRVLRGGVAVVGGNGGVVDRGDRQGRVLRGAVTVVRSHGGVVVRRGRQRSALIPYTTLFRSGLVGEGVAAVVVGRRRVRERPVGVQRQGAVRRAADQGGGEGV